MANSDRGGSRRSNFGGGVRGGSGGGLRGGFGGPREEVDEADVLNNDFNDRGRAANGGGRSSGPNSNPADPAGRLIAQAGIDRMMAGMFSGKLGSQAHRDWLYRSGYDTFPRFGIVTPLPPVLPDLPGARPQDREPGPRPRRPSASGRGDRGYGPYGGRGAGQPGGRGGRGVRFADDYDEPDDRAEQGGPSRMRGSGPGPTSGRYPGSGGPRGRGGMRGCQNGFGYEYSDEEEEFYEDQPPRRGRFTFAGPNGPPRRGSGLPRGTRGRRDGPQIGGRGVHGEVYEEEEGEEEDEGGFVWYGKGTDKSGTIHYKYR